MADIRINALANTATSAASDDYLALDGSANGTRKILATNVAQNVTDVTLGSAGPSVKSSLSARAPRQGLVFDGTSTPTVTVPAVGTADFSIGFWVTPNTSVAYGGILSSVNGGVYLTSLTPKILNESSVVVVAANSALTLSKNSNVVYTRSGTTGTWYINGVAAGSGTDSTNYSVAWSYIGSTLVGTIGGLNLYNRALSASEVVASYEAGAPAGADYGASGVSASNTSLITGDNSTFASDTGYWTKNNSTIGGGVATLNVSGSTIYRPALLTVGKRYRVTWTVVSGQAYLSDGSSSVSPTRSAGTYTEEFIATSASYFGVIASGGSASVDNITLFPIGLLLAPDAAQAGNGLVWTDLSGNGAHVVLPTSGVSWNVPNTGAIRVRGTTSTNGNQQLLGASYLLLSNYQITRIRARSRTGTPLFALGTGSGATNLVALTNLSTTWQNMTIALTGGIVTANAPVWVASGSTDVVELDMTLESLGF